LANIQCPLLLDQSNLRHGFYGMPEDGEIDFEHQLNWIANELGVDRQKMVGVEQVHSAKVRIIGSQWSGEPPKADGMVSNRAGMTLVIKTADCAPVLLVDPQAGVIAAAHAGWRGALAGILEQTVLHMTFLGAQRERIVASIGPCIAQESYQVGFDFQDDFIDTSSDYDQFFTQTSDEKPHFNLAGFCQKHLQKAGIFATELPAFDTFDKKNNFFSYRRSQQRSESVYGRNISVIHLS